MSSRPFVAISLLVILSSAATAQVGYAPDHRFLLPVSDGRVPGALGSLWKAELVAHNHSNSSVVVSECCCAIPEGCGSHSANSTFFPGLFRLNPNDGAFMYVSDPAAVTFSLRIRDVSRDSETWGTSIPVVPPWGAFTSTLHLIDVTVDSRFRSALRIYDFDSLGPDSTQVRVRIYDMCGLSPIDVHCSTTPLVDQTMSLVPRETTTTPSRPAMIMLPDLVAAFPVLSRVKPTILAGSDRPAAVRIEIDPITAGLRFWAFASVTNNATQQVTVIAPN